MPGGLRAPGRCIRRRSRWRLPQGSRACREFVYWVVPKGRGLGTPNPRPLSKGGEEEISPFEDKNTLLCEHFPDDCPTLALRLREISVNPPIRSSVRTVIAGLQKSSLARLNDLEDEAQADDEQEYAVETFDRR